MDEFIDKYYNLLTKEYAGINLTRITNYEDFKLKQIADSIEPQYQSSYFSQAMQEYGVHVDVGFGGGFPILPLAYINSKIRFIGIESRAKKVKVVNEIAQKLGLKNVKCFHMRIENLLFNQSVSVSFKAVGKVNDFLSKLNADTEIKVFFYKGPNFYQVEQEQLKSATKDWELVEEKEIKLQGIEKRYIFGFKNKTVLRRTQDKTTNNLVKLSQLI